MVDQEKSTEQLSDQNKDQIDSKTKSYQIQKGFFSFLSPYTFCQTFSIIFAADVIVTFCTCYVIVLVVYSYSLYDRNYLYSTFGPRTKPLVLFPSSQNIFYKALFMAIPRDYFLLGFNQNQADVEKIIRQDLPRRSL